MEKTSEKEESEHIGLRIPVSLSKEFDTIAEAIPFSKKASIIKECLQLGLAEFKNQRPDIMKVVRDYQLRKGELEKKTRKLAG